MQEAESPQELTIEEFKRPGGLALLFAGLALSAMGYFVTPELTIRLDAAIALGIFASAYIWLILAAFRRYMAGASLEIDQLRQEVKDKQLGLPRVLKAMRDPSDADGTILLLEENKLFGQSMLVSIYHEDEQGFELLTASGRVQNSQMNGLIQIAVESWETAHDDIRESVRSGSSQALSQIRVRPAPTTRAIGNYSEYIRFYDSIINRASERLALGSEQNDGK